MAWQGPLPHSLSLSSSCSPYTRYVKDILVMMHKFAFILLAALVTLFGLSTAVQAAPAEANVLVKWETNAARFKRGMSPLPPVKRTEGM